MNESLLFETVERYADGRMQGEERAFFEEMRRTNSEFDQLVVEHIRFLSELESYGRQQSYRHQLHQIDNKLAAEGSIANTRAGLRGKIVFMWNRYRKNVAVAASIAGLISLVSSGLIVTYSKSYENKNYLELVNKINNTRTEVESLKKSSLKIQTASKPDLKPDYRATGFLIDKTGLLITNAHVTGKLKNIFVENGSGSFFKARVLCSDPGTDLALLKITDSAFKFTGSIPYSIRRSNAGLGERFFTLGFPREEVVYGEGFISAKTGNGGDTLAYQLTVSVNPGNSGAPIINRGGEIIGIITGKDPLADGVVFATKSKHILQLLHKYNQDNPSLSPIRLPASGELGRMDRNKQIRAMEDFVFMVEGN